MPELPEAPIDPDDLAPFTAVDRAKAEAIIRLVWPLAVQAAPCIAEDGFGSPEALRSVLLSICLRMVEQGGMGGLTQRTQSAPGFSINESIDTRSSSRTNLLWPSEIKQLQGLCKADTGGAYAIDTVDQIGSRHSPICSLAFGADYCSCGADLTLDEPLYERLD